MSKITKTEVITLTSYEPDGYEWDSVGVWADELGFYLGTDGGCSCNYEWEHYTDDALTGPLTAEQAVEEVTSLLTDSGYVWHTDEDINGVVEAIRAWR